MEANGEAKRLEMTNDERRQLAASNGWQFRPDSPDLLNRWTVKPFTERGDNRMAFGVVSGAAHGVSFTVFDFRRRTEVTEVVSRGRAMFDMDHIEVDTVWVVPLPAALPPFQIIDSTQPSFTNDGCVEPLTPEKRFNRFHRLVNTDPAVAAQVLTPPVMQVMKQAKLHNWSLVGRDLVCTKHPIFGRIKPSEVLEVVQTLGMLVSMLPPYLGQQSTRQGYPPAETFPPPGPPPEGWPAPAQPNWPGPRGYAPPPPPTGPGYPVPGRPPNSY